MLGEVIRISASEVHIEWLPADEVLTYLVKYRPIQTSIVLQKRNADDLSIIVETNRTMFVISGLDPRFAYGVSVASSNRGGAGNFSEEVVVGCKFMVDCT